MLEICTSMAELDQVTFGLVECGQSTHLTGVSHTERLVCQDLFYPLLLVAVRGCQQAGRTEALEEEEVSACNSYKPWAIQICSNHPSQDPNI